MKRKFRINRQKSLHKKAVFIKLGMGLMLILLSIISYALYNIISARHEVIQTLDAWNASYQSKQVSSYQTPLELPSTIAPQKEEKPLNSYDLVYPLKPQEGDLIGKIIFANNQTEIPIVTGINSKLLRKGALHYAETVLPGLKGSSIILGHREGVFSVLKSIKLADQFVIKTAFCSMTFAVFDIRILDSDDTSVFYDYGFATVSLETCYPFSYGGPAPKRYVVISKLINQTYSP